MLYQSLQSLYLHIPFCAALCHYCDFAKTANFNTVLVERYFQRLQEHLRLWLTVLPEDEQLTTVYLGGGTPSLFTDQLEPLLAACAERLAPDCEITIEANPQDVTVHKLKHWQRLGINRLSLGVQTFHDRHLHFLRRTHSGEQGQAALWRALEFFPNNLSVDLIYGFPQQRMAELESDLETVCNTPVQHLSCYNLTYESGTPLGRAVQRKRLQPLAADREAQMYLRLRTRLAAAGFEHYEVSNWARSEKYSRHNCNYWRDVGYLGIGAGAHGYLPQTQDAGIRYFYTRNERQFSHGNALVGKLQPMLAQLPHHIDTITVDPRDRAAWLLEYLASSLRTANGVDLQRITHKSARQLQPTPVISRALAHGTLRGEGHRLYLRCDEWFRENYWLQQLLPSFVA